MNLFPPVVHKLILTKNDCYKQGRPLKPKGIMVHSTAANNPWLKRYVGPDDGLLGHNKYGNHWNRSGLSACVHAFIGKLADGSIATYQTLPWEMRGWHAGSGSKGSANNTHIGFEICEDDRTDRAYFDKVYREAVELCAMLCVKFGLTEKNIICHSEGYKLGIACNHSDVMHWFPKHGKSMNTFRDDVKKLLLEATGPEPEPPPQNPDTLGLPETYRVLAADSWWGLARRWLGDGQRYPELQVLYGTKKLITGELLRLAIRPTEPFTGVTYTIQSKADTLYSLGKRYGVDWQTNIRKASDPDNPNPLNPRTMRIGDVLVIKYPKKIPG